MSVEGIGSPGDRLSAVSAGIEYLSGNGHDADTAAFAEALQHVQGDAAATSAAQASGGLEAHEATPGHRLTKSVIVDITSMANPESEAMAVKRLLAAAGRSIGESTTDVKKAHPKAAIDNEQMLKTRYGSIFGLPFPVTLKPLEDNKKKRPKWQGHGEQSEDQEHPEDADFADPETP